jgi:hypothetical protein
MPGGEAAGAMSKSMTLILYITVGYTEEFSEILVVVEEILPDCACTRPSLATLPAAAGQETVRKRTAIAGHRCHCTSFNLL